MDNAKLELKRVNELNQTVKDKLNAAISNLKEGSSSLMLAISQEAISEQVTKVNKRIDNIDLVITGIDYAVKRFHEVDDIYANKIKGSVDAYEKLGSSNIRVNSNSSDKINSTTTTKSQNNAGRYLFTGIEIVGGVLTIAVSVLAIVASDGLGSPVAYGAALHGVNSIADGIRDAKNISNGEFDKVGSQNYLRDQAYVPVGKEAGQLIGGQIDAGVKLATGENSNYRQTGSQIGKNIGYGGFYAADMYLGTDSVRESVSILKDVPKLKNLTSTYYEAGNALDGYKRMNNLALWTDGSSVAAKAYAAINGITNSGGIYYDSKDLKSEFAH